MTPEPFNWTALGMGLATAFIAFMQVYNSWRASQRDKNVAVIDSKVNKVVDMTNGTMGLQKQSLAEVTAAKAVITKDPADEEAARSAKASFDEHVMTTAIAQKEKP